MEIEPLNQILESFFPGVVGLEFIEIKDGKSVCQVEVASKLQNPTGVMHGGVAYTLADTGMAMAILSEIGYDKGCSTVEIKMSYFKPVTEGKLHCETKVVRKTRRLAFLESEVFNSKEELVAKASGSFFIQDEA